MTKIIFSVFTTANYTPNLAPHLLIACNELEKQKFSKKQYYNTLVCTNIELKPYGASFKPTD